MEPFFSVVTPTFNRCGLISRVYDSLSAQSYKAFEWIVIDDGSTDGTEELILSYKSTSWFPIKYVKTKNRGKAHALNTSQSYCSGQLYLVFDSDDWCDENALEIFYKEYVNLQNRNDFHEYCGLSALKRYKNKENVGDDYTKLKKYGLTYIDRANGKIKGDKWECLIFNSMKNINYPIFDNEKYMAPGYIWLSLADLGYKTVFINESLSTIEYQADGISKNSFINRYKSALSTTLYYKTVFGINGLNYLVKARYYMNYIRFSAHTKKMGTFDGHYAPSYIFGLFFFLYDKVKLGKVL